MNHKVERDNDVNRIKGSKHPRKVIVAGPGTGKSFLFKELINAKKNEGKDNFLAITFIGKLKDSLADDLCGLSRTMTMHGFARQIVINNLKNWKYYPKIYDIIAEDLKVEGVTNFKVGDANYSKKASYYKAFGEKDVVNYAVNICRLHPELIPMYDLILVDEFQDFNEEESQLVDILSTKNEIVVVGDDDQALYEFKGSSPVYIREKYDINNSNFESHTLRFCSRCTEVIMNYFQTIVDKYNLNNPAKNRIQKEYICYIPDKKEDSIANPKIHLIKNCQPGMIAYKIKNELEKLTFIQKIKDVLIIGEGRSCKTLLEDIPIYLKNYGFKNVNYNSKQSMLGIKQEIVDAYKFIYKDKASLLGWRILGDPTDIKKRVQHIKNSNTLNKLIHGNNSTIKSVAESSIDRLEEYMENYNADHKILRRNLLVSELKDKNINLVSPLGGIDITVCNILNSKGLGADIVFVIGFDQGRIPSKGVPEDSEIYQILVALTRTKKRIYFINTIGKKVSSFIDCLDINNLEVS